MPAKKPGLFDVSGKEPPKPKAPTLKQFIKEKSDAKYPIISSVTLIWFPGTWDNYSIESNEFRCSIGKNHPLYEPLDRDVIKATEGSDTGIAISVEDSEGTIRFCETNVYGRWERIGNAGVRFLPTDGAN